MTYAIAWKKNGQIYTEYGDFNKLTIILKFIECHLDEYELVEITPCED